MTPAGREATDELHGQHEEFIGTLEQDHQVVLGGELKPPLSGYFGAYVLRCRDLDEARQIAARDPLVTGGAVTTHVIEWQLVAVDEQAVDRGALLYP